MLIAAGVLSLLHADRLLTPDAADILGTNPPSYVLLLRGFETDDDRLLGESGLRGNFEQYLVAALDPTGPTVAIARPGERSPPGGAARLQVPDDEEWKDRVLSLADRAALVVIIMYRYEEDVEQASGLGWEIEQIFATLDARRVLIALPAATGLLPKGIWWTGRADRNRAVRESSRSLLRERSVAVDLLSEEELSSAQFLYLQPAQAPQTLRVRRSVVAFLSAYLPLSAFLFVLDPVLRSLSVRPGRGSILLSGFLHERMLLITLLFILGMIVTFRVL